MKNIRQLLGCFAALTVTFGTPAQADWVSVTPPANSLDEAHVWKDVHFINARHGYAVGRGATIMVTQNSGTTWNKLTVDLDGETLNAVRFLNEDTGWVVGNVGVIVKTTNGGQTWVKQVSGANQPLLSIAIVDANTAWIVGESGIFLKTSNGGQNWIQQAGATGRYHFAVQFVGAQHGKLLTQSGFFKSDDSGQSWTSHDILPGFPDVMRQMSFVDANLGWAFGTEGRIFKTIDGGATWNAQSSGTLQRLNAGHFLDSQKGWAVGQGGVALKTTNGGATWVNESSGASGPLNAVHFANPDTGYIVANSKAVFRTTNGGVSISHGSAWSKNAHHLIFDGRTLKFTVSRASHIKAALFDMQGKQSAQLMDESRPAGAHSLGLPDHLTPGQYVLEFRAGDTHQSIPVLLD